uniref:Uncharacterized protein n=1 Tax=Arundo donax TaxID=35708 RepID=A0A0A9FDG0_ARUDO
MCICRLYTYILIICNNNENTMCTGRSSTI